MLIAPRTHLCLIAVLLLCRFCHAQSETPPAPVEFFVSPSGQDSQPGTRTQPFRTLEAARDAARRVAGKRDITIWLTAGRHFRNHTLQLDEHDSGRPGHRLVLRAIPNAEVTLDGGRLVAGSKCSPVTEADVVERLQPACRATIRQLDLKALGIEDFGTFGPRGFSRPLLPAPVELFINGQPLEIARWPNRGEARIPLGEVLDKGSVPRHGDMSDRGGVFKYVTPRATQWTRASDLFISGIFTWGYADDTVRIANIDTEQETFTTVQPHRYGYGNSKQKSLWMWHAVNLLEEIDQPGEYYIDRQRGMAYFLAPPSKKSLAESTIQISLLSEPFVSLSNVSRVSFEGIRFENTRGNGITIKGGEANQIAGCTFRNLGQLAISLSGLRHSVLSCNIVDTGAGGVAMHGGDRKTLAPGGNFVRNCDISRVNRWYKTYRPCISISGVGNRIEHNFLHHCPGQAILLSGNDHVIEFNELGHLIGNMSDQGAIYMGRNPSHAGNVFRHNFIHHTATEHVKSYGNSGIFFDDGDSGQVVEGNVFYLCGSNGAVKYHGGQFNSFINNVVIDCPIMIKYSLWDQRRWDEFLLNEQQQTQLLKQVDVTAEPYKSRYPRLAQIFETPYSTEKQTETRNYVTTCDDPLFTNGTQMDFSVADYAALRERVPGFQAIPFEDIGIYSDQYRVQEKDRR